jgi:hypothetical protein
MLFSDTLTDLQFTLVVDDFGIDWDPTRPGDFQRLHDVLAAKYAIKAQQVCTKHLGMTINHDTAARTLTLTMPGYVDKLLAQHTDRDLPLQTTPSAHDPSKNRQTGPQRSKRDTTPPATVIFSSTPIFCIRSLLLPVLPRPSAVVVDGEAKQLLLCHSVRFRRVPVRFLQHAVDS